MTSQSQQVPESLEFDEDSFVVVDRTLHKETECSKFLGPLLDLMQKNASLYGKSPIFHLQHAHGKDSNDQSQEDAQVSKLFDRFVQGLPVQYQQQFNCSACRSFMRSFGDLSVVDDQGNLKSLLWSLDSEQIPQLYRQSVANVLQKMQTLPIGDEFVILSKEKMSRTLGSPQTNGWRHLSITLDESMLTVKPEGESQDTTTSYNMLARILEDNPMSTINRVHHLIHDNQLPYSTSHRGPVQYLKDVATKVEPIKNAAKKRNLITRLAREAFVGCLSTLRGGMMGYLFECVNAGQTFDEIKRNWETKANPLTYLRPTAPPSQGNIDAAEKVFESLGFTPRDLERVYLTHDQVPSSAILWSAKKEQETSTAPKLFGSVVAKKTTRTSDVSSFSDVPLKTVTFRHFALKVIPNAKSIELLPEARTQPFFFTSGKPDTKPIMQFHAEAGHTASWYTWGMPEGAEIANLKTQWTPVRSIVTFPHMWGHFASPKDALDSDKAEAFKFKRHGIRFLFNLEGAREMNARALCLFPELMRNEFHGVRSTVEAFSNRGKIEYPEALDDVVAGLAVVEGKEFPLTAAVRTHDGQVSRYKIELLE